MADLILHSPVAAMVLLITVVTSVLAWRDPNGLFRNSLLHPYSLLREKRWHTVWTSALIHADWSHLLFNMISFFFFAFSLERIIGHWQFALLYVAAVAVSDISTIVKHKNNPNYFSLGASGGVSAVIFSYILFQPLSKIYLFFIPVGIPAWLFGGIYLIYCAYAAKRQYDNVNHEAHLYGSVAGLLITMLLYPGVVPYFIQALGSGI